jgi:hypothetical protein
MRSLFSLSCAALIVVSAIGCSAVTPDGRFSCDVDQDCPSGMTCHASRCYRSDPGIDTGSVDTGSVDSGVDSGAPVDSAMPDDTGMPGDTGTPIDTGTPDDAPVDAFVATPDSGLCDIDCVTISLTNAYGALAAGTTFTLEGVPLIVPPFGETTDQVHIGLGGDSSLDGTSSVTGPVSFPVTRGATYVLVTGNPGGTPALRLIQVNWAARPGVVGVRFVDMIVDDTSDLGVSQPGGSTTPLTIAADSSVLSYDVTALAPIVLSRTSGGDPGDFVAFDANQLPHSGLMNYLVVIAGRTDRHYDDPNGLVMIPTVHGERAHEPGGVFWLSNGTNGGLTYCEGSTAFATLAADGLAGPFVGFRPDGTGRIFDVNANDTGGCGGSNHHAVIIADGPGRSLVSSFGNLAGGTTSWGAQALLEPSFDGSARQSITLVNATPYTMRFRDTSDVLFPGTGDVPPSTPTVARLTSVTTGIHAFYVEPSIAWSYPWSITSPIAWDFFLAIPGTPMILWTVTVDSPYGHHWTAVRADAP